MRNMGITLLIIGLLLTGWQGLHGRGTTPPKAGVHSMEGGMQIPPSDGECARARVAGC